MAGYNFHWQIFFDSIFNPDSQIRTGVLLTVSIAVAAQLLGVVLGTIAALAKMSKRVYFSLLARFYVWVIRGTPFLVQVMIIFFGFSLAGIYNWPDQQLGPALISGNVQAGVVALGLCEGAYFSEIVRAGILAIDPGQMEAGKSLGMTYALAMRRIVLPQAARVIIPPLGNDFNSMLKNTSLLVMISVPELFVVFTYKNGSGPYQFRPFELFLAAAVWYLALTTLWGFVQSWLERRVGKSTRESGSGGFRERFLGRWGRQRVLEAGAAAEGNRTLEARDVDR
jgi:polar amino acid transport system permease protein